MFVKKLVEKASLKKPGGNLDGLKPHDVNPRLVFHYGIPAGSTLFAYDSVQRILAVSTRDGRIKLFGRENTQALLESDETVSGKFLQFFENQGILLHVTMKNQIEVWDIETKLLSHLHVSKEEITSFTVMQHSLYMYVGYSSGNISVLKLDQEPHNLVQLQYTIPFSASHGNPDVVGGPAVMHILLQPMAESKRILIIFRDGVIVLWEIRESTAIFSTGANMLPPISNEARTVTSACWACPFGSKVVVGYSNGEILIWSIPYNSSSRIESAAERGALQSAPTCKLNLGYKSEKTPIASLKWTNADGKASRLYVMGASDSASANSLQVLLLNEHTESRTIKLGLHLPEPCFDMEIISSSSEQSRHKPDSFLLLGKSGRIYLFDDYMIEKYLVQCQSRSPPSLPKEVMVKLPFLESAITAAKLIADNPSFLSIADEDYISLAKNVPPLLPVDVKQKGGAHLNLIPFSGFAKIKKLFITGHSNGAINLWDVTCPLLLPLLSLKEQSEDDFSLSGIAVTVLYYDGNSRLLISGDQSGMVRIYKFKPEPFTTENNFMSLHGSTKKGNNHIIHSIKLIKVKGAANSISSSHSKHFAVGTDEGYVSMIDIDGPSILYQKNIVSEICTGIISLQFETCSLHGFEKNVLVVATKDSSVLALDSNGNTLSSSTVQPKKPYKAMFMQILGLKENNTEDAVPKQLSLLLCSEKAAYVYSLAHVVQGVKKVLYKKKFSSLSCCWASTFSFSSKVCLILIFTSGKIEIRSLPDLCLLRETTIRGFTVANSKLNFISGYSICSSRDGEIIMVNGDQEIFFFSVLIQKEISWIVESIDQIYDKDLILEEMPPLTHKGKKKGIFNSVFKELKGSKPKYVPEADADDAKESIEELSMIFSVPNFVSDTKGTDDTAVDEEEVELNIDDIDLDDPVGKPKEQNVMMAALNKEILASKFQALKGQ